jgi:hypothetical protein
MTRATDADDDSTEERTITFGVYPDPDGVFAVLNDPTPDVPRGTLDAAQDRAEAELGDIERERPEAGTVTYTPGKNTGTVTDITLREEA